MAYYAVPEGGNYAVYNNGQRVSTTSASGLVNFGLSTTNLGSQNTAPVPAPAPAPAAPVQYNPPPAAASPTPAPAPTPAAATSATTTAPGVAYNPSWQKYGIDQNTWNSMNATQQGVVAASLSAASSLYAANASNVTLADALKAASTDPTLTAKYADALKLDTAAFTQSLQQVQTATSTGQQNMQTQFENERKALAEASAAAGQAYSGFRGKAQQDLAQNESGLVTSSRSQLQKEVQDLTTQFESKYGTGSARVATASFLDPYASSNVSLSGLSTPNTPSTTNLSGELAGGIKGTNVTAKEQDVNNLASQFVSAGQIPAVIPS